MKKIFVLMFIVFVSLLMADINLNFSYNSVDRVDLAEHSQIISDANQPRLPYYSYKIILPLGDRLVDVDVSFSDSKTEIYRNEVKWNGYYYPLSYDGSFSKEITKLNKYYPVNDFEIVDEQVLNGVRILFINVYPYRFNPISKKLISKSNVEISVKTTKDLELETYQRSMYVKSYLPEDCINLEALTSYNNTNIPRNSSSMLIISSSEMQETINPYIAWREEKGISTSFVAVEDIYSSTNGIDEQEKIRNYIKSTYQANANSESPLEYVLLAGDDEIIPDRGTYGRVDSTFSGTLNDTLIYDITVDDLPSDLYYQALDGNWDANNNQIYGEPDDDTDMLPELSIGRIPFEEAEEFNNYFRKAKQYVEESHFTDRFAYFFGEDMDWSPQTWGGDYMDELWPYLPNEHIIETLYERDGTFSNNSVINAINGGFGFINHMGHCNENYLFGLGTGQLDTFVNDKFGFAYSQGCYPAAFDNRTSGGSNNTSEAIGEKFITNSTGAFAFLGNTRYGWGQLGSTDGASQAYNHKFLESMYSNNDRSMGQSLDYSRIERVNIAINNQVMRWVYYEMILFGDPSIELKTPTTSVPYVSLNNEHFSESENADLDSQINPGEEFSITFDIVAEEDWSDAENINISLLENENYEIINNGFYIDELSSGRFYRIDDGELVLKFPENIDLNTYPITINVQADFEGNVFEKNYVFYLELVLDQENWPLIGLGNIKLTPFIKDDRIYTISASGNLSSINLETIEYEQFTLPETQNVRFEYAVSDLNGDKKNEFIYTSIFGKVIAISEDGDIHFSTDLPGVFSTVVILDINGDKENEILVYKNSGEVFFLNKDGEVLTDLGFSIDEALICPPVVSYGEDSSSIYLLSHSGILYSFDGELSQLSTFDNPITMVVDDEQNLIIAEQNSIIRFDDENFSISTENEIRDLILLKKDSNVELVAVTAKGFELFDENGEKILSKETDYTFSDFVISADIDGDDYEEIIRYSTNTIACLSTNPEGEDLYLTPNIMPTSNIMAADIDKDNDIDLIYGSNTGVNVLDIKSNGGHNNSWPTYRGNYFRTGNFSDNKPTISLQDVCSAFTLKQNFPNPFVLDNFRSIGTLIPFSISKLGDVRIDIYNIKGQKVTTIVDQQFSKGSHVEAWYGKDKQGKLMASGVYFIRMNYNGKAKVRKMLFLK